MRGHGDRLGRAATRCALSFPSVDGGGHWHLLGSAHLPLHGEEIEHGVPSAAASPRSPRGKKAKKDRGDGSRTSSSGRDLRTQEYALVFRFWKDDKSRKEGVQMAGNEYPAGPTGAEVISFGS